MDKQPEITYKRQSSGEYYIFVDGKFYCSSDNYRELQEDIAEIENSYNNNKINGTGSN